MTTITPRFDFDKHSFGFGIVFRRENVSEKFIRNYKSVEYTMSVIFLWFAFGLEIEVRGIRNENKM